MRLLLTLTSALVIQAAVVKEECNGVTINDVYHEREVLKTDIDRPYLMIVDYSTNTLYFSYSVNKDDDVFKTAFINLNTKEFGEVAGVNNGFAQTVDQNNHEVYVGGSEGIYKYNHMSKTAEFVGEGDASIWTLYFKDILYYSDFPRQFLYTLIDGVTTRFKDLEDTKIDHFVIDNEDILFYTNSSGLFGQQKGTKDAVLYKETQGDSVRGLTTDINGNVFVCMIDGVYKINKETIGLYKVVDVDDAFGLAFDNENQIIYSNASSLVRLKPNKRKNCLD